MKSIQNFVYHILRGTHGLDFSVPLLQLLLGFDDACFDAAPVHDQHHILLLLMLVAWVETVDETLLPVVMILELPLYVAACQLNQVWYHIVPGTGTGTV